MPYPKSLSLYTIWDEIACLIDSVQDLLSLALTCRTFQELIIPDHLKFRHISCDLRNQTVWKFLENRRRLSRGIRFIELVDTSYADSRLPRLFNGSQRVANEDIAAFQKALLHMTHLNGISWKQCPNHLQGFIDVSHALKSTPRRLDVLGVEFDEHEWVYFNDEDRPPKLERLSIWTLTGLTRVILNCPGPAATQMVLRSCPDIDHLCLTDVGKTIVISVMQDANWKKLRYFTFMSDSTPRRLEEIPAIIISFFDRHPTIECMTFALFGCDTPQLPSSCLPNLRSIQYYADKKFMALTSFLSDDALARLMHWQSGNVDADFKTLPVMDKLDSFCLFENFKHCTFASVLLKAPNLKKVCLFDFNDYLYDSWGRGLGEKIIEMFLQCSSLTHIFCNFPTFGHDDAARQESLEHLCKTFSPLPALKCLEVFFDGETRHARLERDKNGLYSGYQLVTLAEAGGDPEDWGESFERLVRKAVLCDPGLVVNGYLQSTNDITLTGSTPII